MSGSFAGSSAQIIKELGQSLTSRRGEQLEQPLGAVLAARRVFLVGAGRMGILLSTFCMRLNHLAFSSYVVGSIGCLPINADDLLIVASSSGETPTIREIVRKAAEERTTIAAITASPGSTIAAMASIIVYTQAPFTLDASKNDPLHSKQPMKTLFGPTLFLTLETMVLPLKEWAGQTYSAFASSHCHADKSIIAVSAISFAEELMTLNRMEAEIKKELMKIANQVIAVANHSKLNKTALFSVASFDDVDVLVTDKAVSPAFIRELQDRGIDVQLADRSGVPSSHRSWGASHQTHRLEEVQS